MCCSWNENLGWLLLYLCMPFGFHVACWIVNLSAMTALQMGLRRDE